MLILLLIFIGLLHRVLPMRVLLPMVVATVATSLVATYNSDVFQGGRMYWVPALSLAMVVAIVSPPILHPGQAYASDLGDSPTSGTLPKRTKILAGVAVAILTVGVIASAGVGLHYGVVAKDEVDGIATAKQHVLAQWVNRNLQPADGSIGLFFGGVSYDLPDFEIADFLGKGDELIASLPCTGQGASRSQQVGCGRHAEQVESTGDPAYRGGGRHDREWSRIRHQLAEKRLESCVLAGALPRQRRPPRLPALLPGPGTDQLEGEFALLLRNDVAARHSGQVRCVAWPPEMMTE